MKKYSISIKDTRANILGNIFNDEGDILTNRTIEEDHNQTKTLFTR